ncbi:hypothetical protein Golob_014418 [Gossypium lobatum]|uniref:DUF4283 domain-containing protein n=1 Tax=Gossypium lobatum TaxID=34289 RepID=A0A7J8LY71_9ROSI|nr:hypothetical protein [Gossypium lobatum]
MGSNNSQGFKAWAIGKIMFEEKVNREAMYRVLKSLWFTKEDVSFVALKEGVILVKFEYMDKQVAMDVAKAIKEVVAVNW